MKINITPEKTISVITQDGISKEIKGGEETEVDVQGDIGKAVKELGGADNTETILELHPEQENVLVGQLLKVGVETNAKYKLTISDNLKVAEKAPKYFVVRIADKEPNPATITVTAQYGNKRKVTKTLRIPLSVWNADHTEIEIEAPTEPTTINVTPDAVSMLKDSSETFSIETDAESYTISTDSDLVKYRLSKNTVTIKSGNKTGQCVLEIKAQAKNKVETVKQVTVEVRDSLTPDTPTEPEDTPQNTDDTTPDTQETVEQAIQDTQNNTEDTVESQSPGIIVLPEQETTSQESPADEAQEESPVTQTTAQEPAELPITPLSINPTEPIIWSDGQESSNGSVTVTTDGDFQYELLDDLVTAQRNDNTVTFSATGQSGVSQVRFTAQREGHQPNTITLSVRVEEPPRMSYEPNEPSPIIQVGQSVQYQLQHNVDRLQHSKQNDNVTVNAFVGVNGTGSVSITGERQGWSNVTVFGSKHNRETSFTLPAQVLTQAPRFLVSPLGVYINQPGQNASVEIECNHLGNLTVQSTDTSIATGNLSGNRLTITARAVGTCQFRVWKDHGEHRARIIHVIVGKPAVLIANSVAPQYTRLTNQTLQHHEVIYRNGANDYDFEILHPDNLEYDKGTRTVTTKGVIVQNEYYLIKLIPKINGVRQDESTSSYIVIKGR